MFNFPCNLITQKLHIFRNQCFLTSSEVRYWQYVVYEFSYEAYKLASIQPVHESSMIASLKTWVTQNHQIYTWNSIYTFCRCEQFCISAAVLEVLTDSSLEITYRTNEIHLVKNHFRQTCTSNITAYPSATAGSIQQNPIGSVLTQHFR